MPYSILENCNLYSCLFLIRLRFRDVQVFKLSETIRRQKRIRIVAFNERRLCWSNEEEEMEEEEIRDAVRRK
ncbi:hypothetical protein T11_18510 [Trichinella zimbabwensis]|uniref:Uncharacterized protein n=1 Tax=Trichinella zimbabwensis TaxID=268475 RepID=A0A0V1GWZ3_9BILA|nr:hypothetical protein T11_18510 [Trichinella zimbabwensis]